MKILRFPIAVAVLALPMASVRAQTPPYTVQRVSDADRLAEQMRVLAASPNDINALVAAGELTLRLGDPTAARNLLMRADREGTRDGRVKAGLGKVMVQMERPGEALRLFAQAESLGLPPVSYAAERGLAYDLVGQQLRAQRDYRTALQQGGDDETKRRLALSLGISGQREAALAVLDPLLRNSDRGAWRARAFILAMGGDVAGADKIAVNMMPPGMAQGLAPFFQRLPTLSAVDRAFAVHFGEVRPTADRLADARLVPPLAPLPPEPVQVAAVAATPAKPAKPDKKSKKSKQPPVAVAVVAPPVEPQPPRYVVQTVQSVPAPYVPPVVRPPLVASTVPKTAIPAETNVRVAVAPPTKSPVTFAPVSPPLARPPVVATPVATTPPIVAATRVPAPVTSAPVPPFSPIPTPEAPVAATRTPLPTVPAVPLTASPSVAQAPTAVPAPAPAFTPPSGVSAAPVAPSVAAPAPEVAARAPLPAAPKRVPGSEDAILAAIVANISVPATELNVAPMPGHTRVEVAEAAPPVKPVDEGVRQAEAATRKQQAADDAAAAKKQAAAEEVAAKKKAAADKKALAAKKAAADALAAEKKAAAEQKAIERADPERIWVQVAGGATESDLAKAWKQTSGKAPEAFKGRSGWTTPLRATNRVLTGPFKTDAEARAFVNKLAKEGVSAFTFTSTAGQKITRLAK